MMTYLIAILRTKVRKYMFACWLIAFNMFFLSAQAPVASEYQVKAVFIFNFAQFVEWPAASFASDQAPLIIGTLGDNPFGSYLESIVTGEKVNGHPLVIYHFNNISEIKTCQILFINKVEINNMSTSLTSLKGKNILTVSDVPGFLEQGGMIRFITKNNKISLQINPDAARSDNLIISSKLLRLAEIIGPN
jgi:hypothetical protein